MLDIGPIDAFYGDSHILHGIDMRVEKGARVSVLGRNGAGKSTLLKSIMNAGPRVWGAIKLDGRELGAAPSYRRARMGLALVPEDRRIFPHITVMDNIRIVSAAAGAEGIVDPEAILAAFPMLKTLVDRYGSQLSGGQQQMVAVARGMAARPRLLLLDEPTEGLAPVIVNQMGVSITTLCDQLGVGLLLSEQNIGFARHCTSTVYVIESGRLIFHGSWADFDARPDIKERHLSV